MNLVIFFVLVANEVFCMKREVPGQRVCFTDVDCFDPIGFGNNVPHTPSEVGTEFHLFIRSTKGSNFTTLDYLDNSTLQAFDGSKKTFFVVHGLTQSTKTPSIVMLRETILNKFDANVIMVDWKDGCQFLRHYLQAAINTQLVGRQTARLLQLLRELNGLDVKNVHLIGLSLGAEANGFAGKWFKTIANDTIGRITGLDAAGTWFQMQNTSYHLAKSDADFVDAIHTCSGEFPIVGDLGILTPVGHVDFYPNGGRKQPQCTKKGIYAYICNHSASAYYFAESMADESIFTSRPCPGISDQLRGEEYGKSQCNGTCENNCGRMGYYSDIATGRGLQYLTTGYTSCEPYCYG